MKRYTYLILGVVIIIVLLVGYLVFFRGSKKTESISQTSDPSEAPLISGNQNNSGNGDLFNTTASTKNNGAEICAWMNNQSVQGIDSDNDGLPDNIEKIYGTDVLLPDTDNDGYKDGSEVVNGYNPLIAGSARLDINNNGVLDNIDCKQGTSSAENTLVTNNASSGTGLAGILTGQKNVVSTPIATNKPVTTTKTAKKFNDTLPVVDSSTFHVSNSNTAEAISDYLAFVKSKSPKVLTDNVYFVNALVQSFAGNTEDIARIRNDVANYNKTLEAMSVPSSAVAYHQQLISINLFLNDRLGVIQVEAKTNPDAAMQAAQELQSGLPAAISNLSLMQDELVKNSV